MFLHVVLADGQEKKNKVSLFGFIMTDVASPQVMKVLEVYTKGTRAWFEDDQEAWVSASLVTKEITDTNVKLVFQNDEDEERVKNCQQQQTRSGWPRVTRIVFAQWSILVLIATCF